MNQQFKTVELNTQAVSFWHMASSLRLHKHLQYGPIQH